MYKNISQIEDNTSIIDAYFYGDMNGSFLYSINHPLTIGEEMLYELGIDLGKKTINHNIEEFKFVDIRSIISGEMNPDMFEGKIQIKKMDFYTIFDFVNLYNKTGITKEDKELYFRWIIETLDEIKDYNKKNDS